MVMMAARGGRKKYTVELAIIHKQERRHRTWRQNEQGGLKTACDDWVILVILVDGQNVREKCCGCLASLLAFGGVELLLLLVYSGTEGHIPDQMDRDVD